MYFLYKNKPYAFKYGITCCEQLNTGTIHVVRKAEKTSLGPFLVFSEKNKACNNREMDGQGKESK